MVDGVDDIERTIAEGHVHNEPTDLSPFEEADLSVSFVSERYAENSDC